MFKFYNRNSLKKKYIKKKYCQRLHRRHVHRAYSHYILISRSYPFGRTNNIKKYIGVPIHQIPYTINYRCDIISSEQCTEKKKKQKTTFGNA